MCDALKGHCAQRLTRKAQMCSGTDTSKPLRLQSDSVVLVTTQAQILFPTKGQENLAAIIHKAKCKRGLQNSWRGALQVLSHSGGLGGYRYNPIREGSCWRMPIQAGINVSPGTGVKSCYTANGLGNLHLDSLQRFKSRNLRWEESPHLHTQD